jgi:hypothetical protein
MESGSLYVAVLVSESSSDAPDHVPLYEESFVLLRAASHEEAAERAHALGEREQASYRNESGETITWTLKHVVDVSDVVDDTLDDGATVYARHFRAYDAYRRFEPLLSGEEL